jgi:hypothetical protein
MTTFKELTDEVIIRVSGYTQRQDQATYLTVTMTDTPGTTSVSAASGNGTTVTYTVSNSALFTVGSIVTITGLSALNLTSVVVASVPNATSFTVTNATSGSVSGQGGLASINNPTYSTNDPYYQVNVQDGTSLSRGMVEIGNELIWIDNFDQTNNRGYVSPDGRGYRGTPVSEHDSGSRVTISPALPRSVVQKEINNAITGVYPDLFGVYYTTFPFVAARNTYPLPSEALNVLACSWQTIGPSKEWLPVRKWRIDKTANISVFSTARTLSIYDGIVPGRTVQAIYSKKPTTLLLDSDDYTDSGLDESTSETIILGAAYRVAAYLDAPRVTGMSAEADALDQSNPSGAGTQVSRYLFAQYKERLLVEIRRQEELYPPRVHYTR